MELMAAQHFIASVKFNTKIIITIQSIIVWIARWYELFDGMNSEMVRIIRWYSIIPLYRSSGDRLSSRVVCSLQPASSEFNWLSQKIIYYIYRLHAASNNREGRGRPVEDVFIDSAVSTRGRKEGCSVQFKTQEIFNSQLDDRRWQSWKVQVLLGLMAWKPNFSGQHFLPYSMS